MGKKRVFELAKELNMKSKALIAKLTELGIEVANHMSALSENDEEKVRAISSSRSAKRQKVDEKRVSRKVIRRRKAPVKAAPEAAGKPVEASVEEPAEDQTKEDQAIEDQAIDEQDNKDQPEEEKSPDEKAASKPDAEKTAKEAKGKKDLDKGKAKPRKKAAKKGDSAKIIKAPEKEVEPEIPEIPAVEEPPPPEKVEEEPVKAETEEKAEVPVQEPEPEEKPTGKPKKKAEALPKADKGEKAAKGEKTDKKAEKKKSRKAKDAKKKKKGAAAKIIQLPTAEERREEEKRMKEAEAESLNQPAQADDTSDSTSEETQSADGKGGDKKRKRKRKKGVAVKEESELLTEKKPKRKGGFRRREVIEGDALYSGGGMRSKKRGKGGKSKAAKGQKTQITTPKAIKRRVKIDDSVVLTELAKRMGIKVSELIAKLMPMGVMVTANQTVDFETAVLVAGEFGYEIEKASIEEDDLIKQVDDDPDKLEFRPPVVTIMGHVDHGKTSLLDIIRKSHVTDSEAGGITQHIGAYKVKTDSQDVVFLDTPGHEAFTSMRARGADITDLVVLVVAADDGVMPQTVEAVNHSKAAEVPMIVAVNKMDRPDADPERAMRELSEHGLVPEDWGGDTIFVNVSAKTGDGIDDLLEMIALQSEVLELKANPDKPATGAVIEAKLDAGRGPVATVLVQEGTLKAGDSVVCGIQYGKVRAMLDDKGVQIDTAMPSTPVEILGLSGVPEAGDEMIAFTDEKTAKQLSGHRSQKQRSKELAKSSRMSLEKLYEKIQEGVVKDLNLIVRADVHGSVEALTDSLSKLTNKEVKINVSQAGTGTITESDISLATVSDAIIIGFNVRASGKIQALATEENVDIRYYNVIYDVIKDLKDAVLGLMESTYDEKTLGRAEVREVFHVPKIGSIAGSYVTDGKIQRGKLMRVLRDGVVIYEGKNSSLKRFKDDAKEVNSGYECGIGVENFNDIKMGDVLECYYLEEIKPSLE